MLVYYIYIIHISGKDLLLEDNDSDGNKTTWELKEAITTAKQVESSEEDGSADDDSTSKGEEPEVVTQEEPEVIKEGSDDEEVDDTDVSVLQHHRQPFYF